MALAADLDIDLGASWMVGDSARDVEAGQRAGCRTVRVRLRPSGPDTTATEEHENVQADFVVRNLVDAARVILREGPPTEGATPEQHVAESEVSQAKPTSAKAEPAETMTDSRVRQEILRYVRQMVAERQAEEFSFTKLLGGIVQMLALLALVLTFWRMLQHELQAATLWGVVTVALQAMALTFFTITRPR